MRQQNSDAVSIYSDGVPSRLAKHLAYLGLWDGICRVDAGPPADPPADSSPETPTSSTDVDDDSEDLGPLKRAYERQKEESRKLKEEMKAIRDALGNADPSEVQRKLEELADAERRKEENERAQAEARIRFEKEKAELETRYKQQLKQRDEQIQERDKEAAYQQLFNSSGGDASEYRIFRAAASEFFEYDPETKEIKSFKRPDGSTLYAEGESGEAVEAKPADFIMEVRKGTYGKALQQCFKPLNQASGAELPMTASVNGADVLVINSDRDYMAATKDPKLAALLRSGKFQDNRRR